MTFLTATENRSNDPAAALSDVFQLPSEAMSSADSLRPGQSVWVLHRHGQVYAIYRFGRVCDRQTGVQPGHVRVEFAEGAVEEVDTSEMGRAGQFKQQLPVLIEEPRLLFADRAVARSPETAPAAAAAQSGAHAGGASFLPPFGVSASLDQVSSAADSQPCALSQLQGGACDRFV